MGFSAKARINSDRRTPLGAFRGCLHDNPGDPFSKPGRKHRLQVSDNDKAFNLERTALVEIRFEFILQFWQSDDDRCEFDGVLPCWQRVPM